MLLSNTTPADAVLERVGLILTATGVVSAVIVQYAIDETNGWPAARGVVAVGPVIAKGALVVPGLVLGFAWRSLQNYFSFAGVFPLIGDDTIGVDEPPADALTPIPHV